MEDKLDIRGVPETMLQTLYARAMETSGSRHCIDDPEAVEIVSRLSYDFSKAHNDKAMSSGVIARTILLDRMCREYLEEHPGASVINIACGLDTRCCRLKGKYSAWYNLDLPETMEIRSRFLPDSGCVHSISASAVDPGWPGLIGPLEGELLIIIEGLSMYLSQEDVKEIFRIIDGAYPSATVFFEAMNPWIAGHVKEKSIEGSAAKFSWGIKNGRELEKLTAPFKSLSDRSLTEGMAEFMPVYRFLGKIGFVRNISNKILVMEK